MDIRKGPPCEKEAPNATAASAGKADGVRPAFKEDCCVALAPTHLLLRGCKLRNTDWVIGLVLYTGHETKILMNSANPPRKTSRVEHQTNTLTLMIWLVQSAVCLACGICSGLVADNPEMTRKSYLGFKGTRHPAMTGFIAFFTWMVLTCNVVPISLVVQMGIVKSFQAYFIASDEQMIHRPSNTGACPRSSELNEELGQVKYLFTDKTGTLTQNIMQLKKCCIGGISYGQGLTEIRRQVMRKSGMAVPPEPVPDPNEPLNANVSIVDASLRRHLQSAAHPNHGAAIDFFLHLAVNHCVVPEFDVMDQSLRYSASSPDEGALVYAARHYGVQFVGRSPEGIQVLVNQRMIHVEVIANFEFTSARKRSTIVCRIPPLESSSSSAPPAGSVDSPGRILVFCKGADNAILPLLLDTGTVETRIFDVMHEYALDGLRTLCITMRELASDEFVEWYRQYQEASVALEGRAEKVEKVVAMLERDLVLQGVSGIEDKLQEHVGETIEMLRAAGIHVWMLTGDKVETAVNISIATSLLTRQMQQVLLVDDEIGGDASFLRERLQRENEMLREEKQAAKHETELVLPQRAVVVDGETLELLLSPELCGEFLALCRECETVVCARTTPHQKGAVVSLVKKVTKAITLAIGDGANDCNMIQMADVGVGLRGEEGMQAFNSADYGLSQFSFLQRLLLFHGRLNYRRLGKLVGYMFYKNLVLVLPIFYYGFISLFSGQRFYFEFLYQMYNVIFTALPITLYAIFDRDVDARLSLKFPQLYSLGQTSYYFNMPLFGRVILNGIVHSIIVFVVPTFACAYFRVPLPDGRSFDLWMVGTMIFLNVMVVVNLKVLLESYYITWFIVLGISMSLAACIFFMLCLSSWPGFASTVLGSSFYIFVSPTAWISLIVAVTLCLLRDFGWKTLKRNFFPTQYHLIQGREYGGEMLGWPTAKVAPSLPAKLWSTCKSRPMTRALSRPNPQESVRGFAFSEADPAATQMVRVETFLRPPAAALAARSPSLRPPRVADNADTDEDAASNLLAFV
eukprot:GHVT01043450.1.p1 GENE.GHVT01043450.1~~GHVT01043450.1.p1  ORF type:complete len:1154 (+),score=253.51 GHVT01043450.1:379-3462(+)